MSRIFKYSINAVGNPAIKQKYYSELLSLGYEPFSYVDKPDSLNTVTSCNCERFEESDELTIQSHPFIRDFNFNLDNQWEYEAALAIAAIHKDDIPHVGEWVKVDRRSFSYQEGGFAKILAVDGESFSTNNRNAKDSSLGGVYNTEKATPTQLIGFFKQKQNNMPAEKQKVIGYRLLQSAPGTPKGTELREMAKSSEGDEMWTFNDERGKTRGWPRYIINSSPEWFEPIYEEVEVVEKLTIGSRNIEIMVTSKKRILTTKSTVNPTIEQLNKVMDYFSKMGDNEVGEWATWPNKESRFIRIGCQEKNNLFSISEIQKVIDTYNRLNP